MARYDSYWRVIWKQFCKHKLGFFALWVVIAFCLVGIYAPFLASSKPLVVQYDGTWYFPLFRYLFYSGFYTKRLDIFFNLLIFTVPSALIVFVIVRHHSKILMTLLSFIMVLQVGFFLYFAYATPHDPASNFRLNKQRDEALRNHPLPSWDFDLKFMTPYAKLNLILRYQQREEQQKRLLKYSTTYMSRTGKPMPTLWQEYQDNQSIVVEQQTSIVNSYVNKGEINSPLYAQAKAQLEYIRDRQKWLQEQLSLLHYEVMPLIRPFHWEDDAGGSQNLNRSIPFWELTRTNRKDLVAALIFGVRISLVVGILAVTLSLAIALPIGSLAGFYGGKFDIVVSRLLEIWESMPTFFMLLMVVAIMQSKSIFLVISVIGLFGWTTFSRFIRGEFFKQRNLPYVESCRAMGYPDTFIMFSHILPNAIPPVLTLLPFSIMAAIISEAGLSFLGLGEEGSCSWGVLMDEGRTAFPGESYLLWPPAILLTTLLIAIALVGDSLRDSLDPKMHR